MSGSNEYVKMFERVTDYVGDWATRRAAQQTVLTAINAALPSEMILVMNTPDVSSPGVVGMDQKINAERERWAGVLLPTGATVENGIASTRQSVGVRDIRDLAAELGLPIPAVAQLRRPA